MDLFVTLLLVLQLLAVARSDFETDCPALCQCKWKGGKKTADCAGRGYTTIPPNIDSEVQVLNLDGNYIKELSKDAFSSVGLLHLQKISLKDCKIQRLDENAFSQLKILSEINLEKNNISKLPAKLFDGNERLSTLSLANNQIQSLTAIQFPPLRHLKKLDLSSCGLRRINTKAFVNLGSSVETIRLHDNLLQNVRGETFENLHGLKYLSLHNNPWLCDCKLKKFRDLVVKKNLLTDPGDTVCSEPERITGQLWSRVTSQDFACKPEVEVTEPVVVGRPGLNATLRCQITGNPVPGVKWVLNGRIIQNNSAPLHSRDPDQVYVIEDLALAEGGIERNFSLTVTAVTSSDLGQYSCVAINNGGMAERNVTLTFTDPRTNPVLPQQKLTIIIGVAAGALFILIVFIIVLCCFIRKRGKDKTGHSLNGSVLGYTDPAGEKLLPQNGTLKTLNRTNPLPKPHRTGEYGHHHHHHQHGGQAGEPGQEMADYGPASYVPGDRYDEYGEGRGSASNSDQTGTLSRTSYHSSDPDHYPDLLDIPGQRVKQQSASPASSVLYGGPLLEAGHPHQLPHPLVLHPAHLPHHAHHLAPFQRTGTLPHNFSTGTLPHQHHPRSVSCDHSGGYPHPGHAHNLTLGPAPAPVVPSTQRPGYVTLPRRPRGSWAGQQQPRDTPSPAFSLSLAGSCAAARDPIYDGVGPRTSADGSSVINLNKSMDNAAPGPQQVRYHPQPVLPALPPLLAQPIKEELGLPQASPNILDLTEPAASSTRLASQTKLLSQLSAVSEATLSGEGDLENLSAYFEPFGSALVPCAPGTRDSIASQESDSLLAAERKEASSCSETEEKEAAASPRVNMTPPLQLQTIPELEPVPDTEKQAKKQPPPTLPKPKKPTKVSPPVVAPKPKLSPAATNGAEQRGAAVNGGQSFQDETLDGSEV